MSLIKQILEDYKNRTLIHYTGLNYQVSEEIERLQELNECPSGLWEAYHNYDEEEPNPVVGMGKYFNQLLEYADEHYEELPISIKAIVEEYWYHPEKEKDAIER